MQKLRIAAVFLATIAIASAAGRVHAQSSSTAKRQLAAAPAAHVVVPASEVKWGPAPPGLPAGTQAAVLEGDPTKAGVPFVVRLKFANGTTVAPHWHPTDENVTVLNGTLQVAMGEKLDESALKDLAAGSFVMMPKKMAHYARARGETTVQIHAMGPFAITYVNPKDDPRTNKKTN